jgi:hypothetical protein
MEVEGRINPWHLVMSFCAGPLSVRERLWKTVQFSFDPTFWGMFTSCYYELTVSSFFWTWWNISYLNCCWLWFELAIRDGDRAIQWRAACCLHDLTLFGSWLDFNVFLIWFNMAPIWRHAVDDLTSFPGPHMTH